VNNGKAHCELYALTKEQQEGMLTLGRMIDAYFNVDGPDQRDVEYVLLISPANAPSKRLVASIGTLSIEDTASLLEAWAGYLRKAEK
jgi:hypothetical protein